MEEDDKDLDIYLGLIGFSFVLFIMIYIILIYTPLEYLVYSMPQLENKTTCLNVSSFGSSLLGIMIALLAFIISFVAFLLPFMILLTSQYQDSFFSTVMSKESIDIIKESETCKGQVIEMSKNLKYNTIFMNSIYRRILVISIGAILASIAFILFIPVLFDDSKNSIYFLLAILIIYLLYMINQLKKIFFRMFKPGAEGSYPRLADIQLHIITETYKKREERGKK